MFDSTRNPDPYYASNPLTNNEELSFDIAANAENDWMTLINTPCSATNQDQNPYSWWHAEFGKAYTVKKVKILTYNYATDPDIGYSVVYIGGK